MTNQDGIPQNFFGADMTNRFYGLVGKVVMLATVVEDRLLCLLWSLDDAAQGVHSGKPAARIIELCRAGTRRVDQDLARRINEHLDEAERLLRFRNSVVHSLWPINDLQDARG